MEFPVWQFSDYKSFLKSWLSSLKKRSGELQSLASFLGVHPSRLSKILKGVDHPTSEQAFLIGKFLELGEIECNYFIELVNLARASSPVFRNHTKERIKKLREQLESPSELNSPSRPMTPAEERIYHSSYRYAAVWLMSSISSKNDLGSIAETLELSPDNVKEAAQFLVKIGLCNWNKDRLTPGARLLEFKSDSPQIETFLTNWRLHSINKMPKRKAGDFFYSEPMAIGLEAERKIRTLLDKTLTQIREIISEYPSDKGRCLNIDFFDI